MARQTLAPIVQLTGTGIDHVEFIKRVNENFAELYAGDAEFTQIPNITDATTAANLLTKFNELLASLRTAGIMASE